MTSALASRIFRQADQIAFARLSADVNPIHLDETFARRTQMGAVVVHGIHSLAWAADAALAACPIEIANIRARFLQPLYLDEPASVHIRERSADQIRIEVTAAGSVISSIWLSAVPARMSPQIAPSTAATTARSEPADPDPEQLASCSGAIGLAEADLASLFPALVGAIGRSAASALIGTSAIVGMECPGLHSLFTGIKINVGAACGGDGVLAYAVTKLDPRFRSLQIAIAGSGVVGQLEAFSRPKPPAQPGMAEIAARLAAKPFAGQRVLIVGGSRGLGEVTAKIIAAGGGHALITYREGAREAGRIAAEIASAGGQCDVMAYDVTSPDKRLQTSGAIDCCYYFATPRIFQRKSKLYEPARLQGFLDFYATGLFDLCAALPCPTGGRIPIFYPSTVAIEQGPGTITEYAMAKAAGEVLATYINESMSHIHVVCRRLPRILTDQTATVGVARSENALEVMLPIVHELQQMARHLTHARR